jgi:pimeloyl-ACP methyl ester carboxylesterase
MNRTDVTVHSRGLAAWHYPATSDALAGPGGRPCAVMAHGFGATRDCGLEGFAEALAGAGLDVLVFDYRGFGGSDGDIRQLVDIPGQQDDYRAAIAAARELAGVDPERIVLWGVSFAGGHVFALAAGDDRLAAAVALTPAPDGLAALLATVRRDGPGAALKATAAGLRDLLAAARGRPPVLVPLAAEPGEFGVLTAPGALAGYTGVAGAAWRNEFTGRTLLRLGTYRPGTRAGGIGCPLLVQIADLDQTAPPAAAEAAAGRVPLSEVRHYPCDHFDVYPGQPWHRAVVEHQIAFLTRHLAPS